MWGLSLQVVFALLVLKNEWGQRTFKYLGDLITRLLDFANVGASFVFGPLGDREAWPRIMTGALGAEGARYAMIFAFQVLPTIIFIAALFAILYYYGVMQFVVRVFAWGMRKVMKASGAETLNVAASIFMGQTEAPLTIRPYLPKMTQSELMTVMTSGMAHISGGIMAAYILFGIEAKHLLTAVIMTAPGTLMMAKMFVPETDVPETMGTVKLEVERTDVNVIDAAGRGTGEGLHLALNVGAMLVSFLALVALLNALLGVVRGFRVHLPRHRLAGEPQHAADPGLAVLARRLGDGRAVAGCGDHRQPARHAHGAQRVRGLLAARAAQGVARSEFLHHRDVRPVRVRELQLHRHSDRRHRGARAEQASRPGAAWHAGHAGGHAGQLHDGDDCGVPAMSDEYARVQAAAVFVRERIPAAPEMAIVLGSGLGDFASHVGDAIVMPYESIPGWPPARVIGHAGKLVVGSVRGKAVAVLSGRAHFYEGHPMANVVFATRVVAALGVKTLLLTNAAGGINTSFSQGALMVIDDHINLVGTNPLVGPNDERFGPRFPT